MTTEVVGNCGFSPYPLGPDRKALRDFANGIFCGSADWGWEGAQEYLAEIERRATLVHVRSLVGHGSMRIAVAGHRQGPLEPAEADRLEGLLSESLSDGACGFSTGLMYAPGSSAPFEELVRLCRTVARHDKIYATHMRSYSRALLESVEEQLELARQSGCRLQISHLQAVGRANWDKPDQAIKKIEKARQEGLDVAFDIHPYLAGATVMTQLLPQWALEGGMPALLALLKSPARRAEIAAEVREENAGRWSDIVVSSVHSGENSGVIGKSLGEIARERACDPVEATFDLLIEEEGAVNIIAFNQSEENLRQLLTHPLCLVISDGFYVRGKPHPRLFGTFPALLGGVCRDKRWLDLAEAVHKVTQMPAWRFGIKHRGLVAPGYFADLVVFDAGQIGSAADYQKPEQPPQGIRMVFREGRMVVPAVESVPG